MLNISKKTILLADSDMSYMRKMKEEFLAKLKTVKREGIEELIHFLEKSDFFIAPASTRFHGDHEGGLVEHSLKVYEILKHKVEKGDAVFIRYEGPKGSGMPEMFYTSEAISSDKELGRSIALITDGRFSGASTGPVIGHCSPEAADGGPIALVEEGDLIEIDIAERKLNIIGIKGEKKSSEEIDAILAERRKNWKPKEMKYKKGALRLFSEHAVSPMKGAYLAYED